MPKIVDHDVRRAELAAALWRVALRDGIDHISVRTVAAEAGSSPGALRHYFATQDEFAAFALQAVVDAATERILGHLGRLSGMPAAIAVLEEMLPLDAARRAEIGVYLTFLGRGGSDGHLERIRRNADVRSREAVAAAVQQLVQDGSVHPDRDGEAEVDALYALIDGLALHGTLFARRYPPTGLRAVLRGRLNDLRTAPAGSR